MRVAAPVRSHPELRSLEKKHLIKTHTASGKKFFLIIDPRVAIEKLASEGKVNEDHLFEINELLEDLNQEPIPTPSKTESGKKP